MEARREGSSKNFPLSLSFKTNILINGPAGFRRVLILYFKMTYLKEESKKVLKVD